MHPSFAKESSKVLAFFAPYLIFFNLHLFNNPLLDLILTMNSYVFQKKKKNPEKELEECLLGEVTLYKGT